MVAQTDVALEVQNIAPVLGTMIRWQQIPVMFATLALLALPSPCADAPAKRSPAGKSEKKSKAQSASQNSTLSGCVDEGESGRYVLTDDVKLSPIVQLQADGFPNEGFAKYMGQKVTVQGRRAEIEGRSVFAVRKIDIVSETCAPARTTP